MACIEGFFIYNAKGDPIIHRLYGNDISLRVISDVFRTRVLHSQAQAVHSGPICQVGSITLAHVVNRDVYLVAVMRNNANVMMALEWLSALLRLFGQYFTKVKEKYIRANFVLIYELLDEACDNGVPQITDALVLKKYVFQKGTHVKEKKEAAPAPDVTLQVTGAVAHRSARVSYKKNEVYLDIVETLDVLCAADGTVLRNVVNGRMLLKAFLSGMPECRLGLNMHGEDSAFASIVRQHDWEANRSISFVPPDNGSKTEFEVMRYRVSDQVALPFRVIPNILEVAKNRLSVDVHIRSNFEPGLAANSIVLCVPVPAQTAKVKIKKSKGEAKYDGAHGVIRWSLARFRGQKDHNLSADVALVHSTREKPTLTKAPIELSFVLPMYCPSPMRVMYLKIQERSGYSVDKWVRKICNSGTYHIKVK